MSDIMALAIWTAIGGGMLGAAALLREAALLELASRSKSRRARVFGWALLVGAVLGANLLGVLAGMAR